ncbi:hypothetical protein KC19_6G121400 [Ceratodon purpureus]|uniref:EF-hand domain-containing protein n=1 Tax=Ceratodon purpureus TaxID=3225 RepID=A0A8T0HF08_CERPU|nr:hypothetical protein KC19_6G121400 [Ceratodon purpureus]
MDALGQPSLQGLSKPRMSWNSPSTPSTQPLSRVAPATPNTTSSLGPYAFLGGHSPRSSIRIRSDNFDLKESDREDIKLAFELYDTRKVGRLCYRELKAAMRALECKVNKAEVQKLMHQFSKLDNDEIGKDEFMQIMLRKYKEKNPEVNIGKLFAVYDEESKGKISQKNLRRVAKGLGRALTDEQLEAMIGEFDKDGDGEVNQGEFFEIMKRTHLGIDT